MERTWRGTISLATAFEVTVRRSVTALCIRSVVPMVKEDKLSCDMVTCCVSKGLAVTSSFDDEGWPIVFFFLQLAVSSNGNFQAVNLFKLNNNERHRLTDK